MLKLPKQKHGLSTEKLCEQNVLKGTKIYGRNTPKSKRARHYDCRK